MLECYSFVRNIRWDRLLNLRQLQRVTKFCIFFKYNIVNIIYDYKCITCFVNYEIILRKGQQYLVSHSYFIRVKGHNDSFTLSVYNERDKACYLKLLK